jgi:hypothetical protein
VGFVFLETLVDFGARFRSEFSSQCKLGDISENNITKYFVGHNDIIFEHTIEKEDASQWNFFFYNCESGSKVTFDLELEMYNKAAGLTNYLPVGEIPLPLVYGMFTVLNLAALAAWIYWIVKQKGAVRWPAYLLLIVLAVKCALLLTDALIKWWYALMGSALLFSPLVLAVISTMRGVLVLSLVLVIGSGLSFVRQSLPSSRERILVVTALGVQGSLAFIGWFASELLDSSSTTLYIILVVTHIVDILTYLSVFYSLHMTKKYLQVSALVEGASAKALSQVEAFKKLYSLLLIFVYLSKMLSWAMWQLLPFNFVWISTVLQEGSALLFFCGIAWLLRKTASPHASALSSLMEFWYFLRGFVVPVVQFVQKQREGTSAAPLSVEEELSRVAVEPTDDESAVFLDEDPSAASDTRDEMTV